MAEERKRNSPERLAARARKAAEAARELADTSVSYGTSVALSPGLLLGTGLLAAPAGFIAFQASDGTSLSFERRVLRAARAALLRPFADLRAWLDDGGLHFRWRGGRGGLDLLPAPEPAYSVNGRSFDSRGRECRPSAADRFDVSLPGLALAGVER